MKNEHVRVFLIVPILNGGMVGKTMNEVSIYLAESSDPKSEYNGLKPEYCNKRKSQVFNYGRGAKFFTTKLRYFATT